MHTPTSRRSGPTWALASTPSLGLGLALLFAVALSGARPASAQCTTGSCLAPHAEPGCSDPECCETVCAVDPLCCEFGWDVDCVLFANQLCVGLCGAGVGGDCLVPHATPACGDQLCCETICTIDPFCCDTAWDITCALFASLTCDLGMGGTCGDPDAGSCFEPHGSGACDDLECCDGVCGVDPSCCDAVWDIICVAIAEQVCQGPCIVSCPPGSIQESEACGENLNDPCYFPSRKASLQTLECGDSVCGSLGSHPGRSGSIPQPDVDVYRVVLEDGDGDGLVGVELSFAAAFNGYAALRAGTDCGLIADAILHVDTSLCIEAPSALACVEPGEYRLIVAPGDFPDVSTTPLLCSDPNTYAVTVSCSDAVCAPPCTPESGPCLEPHKSPGCNDEPCCEGVCAVDPACCEIQWDNSCVQAAVLLCATPPANDDCAGAIPLGVGEHEFTTLGATTGGPPLPASCDEGFGNSIDRDIWYSFESPRDGLCVMETCGDDLSFDSRLAVYSGTCAGLSLVACNDDSFACIVAQASHVEFEAACGVNYLIRLGGFSEAAGSGTLTIEVGLGPSCPGFCPADLNGDGSVGSADLAILLGAWATSGAADLDGSGTVDAADLATLLGAWGPCT